MNLSTLDLGEFLSWWCIKCWIYG